MDKSQRNSLLQIGGIAALAAGILFRRNLGVEISLFRSIQHPDTVIDWFNLLQTNRWLALSYLNFFDMINAFFLGILFLSLFHALKTTNSTTATIALYVGFLGVVMTLFSNSSLSMLSLSNQYSKTTTVLEQETLEASGLALLALNRFSLPGSGVGSGGYLSLLFLALSSVIFSALAFRSKNFRSIDGTVGLVAGGIDILYCLLYLLLSSSAAEFLAIVLMPAAGLVWMVWHVLLGVRLLKATT